MSVAFSCGQCGKRYTTDDKFAGKAIRCKACGGLVRIPAGAGAEVVLTLDATDVLEEPARPAPRMTFGEPPPDRSIEILDADDADDADDEAVAGADGLEILDTPGPRNGRISTPKPKSKSKKGKKGLSRDRLILIGGLGAAAFVILVVGGLVLRTAVRMVGGPALSGPVGPIVVMTPLPPFPEPGPPIEVAPGVVRREVRLGMGGLPGQSGKIWVYTPAGEHAPGSLPCILITGAGSNLITGMDLTDGDVAEHIPWAQAGFAVVAYELDGAVRHDGEPSDNELKMAAIKYFAAHAGLANARVAIEYALARLPEVDPNRLFAVGHSSAGTMALLFAEHEPRLAGCVAFAPVSDIEKRYGPVALGVMSMLIPNLRGLIGLHQPKAHESQLRVPLLLFHAEDDSNVPVDESREIAARLQALGKNVTLKTVPTGDHYDAMIDQGIPTAIEWASHQNKGGGAPAP